MLAEGLQGASLGAPGGQSVTNRALEGKEQFLKLLVAQISNQNPMNPVDDKDMVGQLAQFSAIEQAIETNTRLESLEKTQANAARLNMAALIGKEGAANTSHVKITEPGKTPTPLAFSLDSAASEVTLRIVDKEGKLMRSIDMGRTLAGGQAVPWDGLSQDHTPLPAGAYRMQVKALNEAGAEIASRSEIRGKIEKLEMDGSEPAVYLGRVRVPVSDLTEIHKQP